MLPEHKDTNKLVPQAECFGLDKDELPSYSYPLQFKLIQHEQQHDSVLLQKAKTDSFYHLKTFCGGGKHKTLICCQDKIVEPTSLQQRMVS